MKKRILSLLLAIGLLAGLTVPAFAEEYFGADDWRVTFTGTSMDSNFKTGQLDDVIDEMEPGDKATFNVRLSNGSGKETGWWMTNKVIKSFEDNSIAKGGAYTYKLVYTAPGGADKVLYSSDTVGGEDTTGGVGLHQATGALEEYFYLGQLTKGQDGFITLEVGLEGETQGNDYQDTLADLQMTFAVEVKDGEPFIPDTNDPRNMIPFIIAAGVSGALILTLVILKVKRKAKEQ